MRDLIEAVAYVALAGGLLYGAWRIGTAIDDHLTPEQKKELEREEWRHS